MDLALLNRDVGQGCEWRTQRSRDRVQGFCPAGTSSIVEQAWSVPCLLCKLSLTLTTVQECRWSHFKGQETETWKDSVPDHSHEGSEQKNRG